MQAGGNGRRTLERQQTFVQMRMTGSVRFLERMSGESARRPLIRCRGPRQFHKYVSSPRPRDDDTYELQSGLKV